MARSLVIVESPAKAKTINKYLGRGYTVKASYGHVMDLPTKTIGILLPGEQNGKRKKKSKSKPRPARKAKPEKPTSEANRRHLRKYLRAHLPGDSRQDKSNQRASQSSSDRRCRLPAGDPDREGEAICAHLAHVLSKPFRPPVEVETNGKNSKKKKLAPENGNGNAKVTAKEVAKLVVKPPKAEPAATSASKIFRVMFNEITPKAMKAAFEHPRR